MFADMGQERVRGPLLGAAIVAATMAVAGCGGDKDDAAPSAATTPAPAATTPAAPSASTTTTEAPVPAAPAGDPVVRAVAALKDQKGGLGVSMSGRVQAKGVESKVTGKGRIDRAAHRGNFTVTTNIQGTDVAIKSVTDGHAVYLTSPIFDGRLPGKRSWMRIDLAQAAKEKGLDLSALGTNGPSQDPSQVLDYLSGAGPAKKVGTETVRGAKATHYRVTVDLRQAKAKSATSSSKLAVSQLIDTLDGATTFPVDVWIDGRDRIVRERVHYTAQLRGVENDLDFTTDFTGFGVAVKVDAPPRSDTVDGIALLKNAQKVLKEQQQANGQPAG